MCAGGTVVETRAPSLLTVVSRRSCGHGWRYRPLEEVLLNLVHADSEA